MDEADNPGTTQTDEASDFVLLAAMQAGQAEALQVIYRRYGRLVYTLALRVLNSPEEAEDLCQEVFLKLWQQPTYDASRGSLSTFLAVLTRSRAIDRVRSRGARSRLLQRWQTTNQATAASPSPLEAAVQGDQAQRVREALDQLTHAERDVLEIAYYEGLSQSQIAERLNIPLGTVKTRSRQALKKLRNILKDLT
ncbi:MAG: sigma-70 family RNA polymerase sigma factor [Leptolyngbyaceae cyanobacterium T60_A2020_046]|nr:sigma-70 family RNA polymerase sigma factor [Leptolyngbyaceae cyanobacterium T60_A2020_046]